MKLLGKSNTKTMKGEAYGYETFILHLAPSTLSGYNVCPMASNGCIAACLNTAGMGVFSTVQAARVRKTLMYYNEREEFMRLLTKDIEAAKRSAARKGLKLAIRLNGTSDLPVLAIKMASQFPDVQFYDYTKIDRTFSTTLPENYHLTFSRSEDNQEKVEKILGMGFNVAVVFGGETLPETYLGYKVVDGDESDLRFLDEKNVVVGLTTKARAKQDESGFVIWDEIDTRWEETSKMVVRV